LGLTLLVGACAPVLLSPAAACAAAAYAQPHAALVVDTGARTTTYCVALDGGSVSGTHLIELASAQFGLDYRFGFAGRAICRLDEVGVDGDDCFGDYPDYWGYFHGNGASGWAWATGSAADHAVDDGDVEGWSWGAGDSGTTHPAPPVLSIDDVCDRVDSPSPSPSPPVPEPSPSPSGGGGNGGGGTDDGSGGGGGTDDGASSGTATTAPSASVSSPSPRTHPASGSPSAPAGSSPAAAAPSSADPDVVRAAAAAPPASGGPPIGGLVTVAAIALLGLAGWFNLRRREGGA
jgi:hypothetical protein